MNNMDKIKNMDIQQLAQWINDFDTCECCNLRNTGCDGSYCLQGITYWLMSEDIINE